MVRALEIGGLESGIGAVRDGWVAAVGYGNG
jgi:hypothetical protein